MTKRGLPLRRCEWPRENRIAGLGGFENSRMTRAVEELGAGWWRKPGAGRDSVFIDKLPGDGLILVVEA